MATDNQTPDVLSAGLSTGRVYAGKTPALIQGLGGQLYANDRQITDMAISAAGGSPDDIITYRNAAGGADVKCSLASFIDWADKDVTDELPPSLPDDKGESAVLWRPWQTVNHAQHPAAKVNEAPDAATAAQQLPAARIIDGTDANMGGTIMPDDKAASDAPAPKPAPKPKTVSASKTKAAAASSKAKGKTASVTAAGAQAAQQAATAATTPAPAGPNTLVGVAGVPVAGTPAAVGKAGGPEGASNAPTGAAPGALGIDTASNDGGNETGSQNEATANQTAAQTGNVPGTTGGTAQQPSAPPKQ